MVAVNHGKLTRLNTFKFRLATCSGVVFATINTHAEVSYFLIVKFNPPLRHHGFVLQIFCSANFLVDKEHQQQAAEHSLRAHFNFRVRFLPQ